MADEDDPQQGLQIVVPYKHLPPEVLIMIFLRTTPPSFLLDPSLTAGPHSPWCKALVMKQTVPLVCKEWYTAGIEMLYEQVVLRRLGQIPSLLQTLEESPGRLSDLIKEITLYTNIPMNYGASFVRHIQRIINLSPRLLRFNFNSPCLLPPTAKLPVLSASITHIQLGPSTSNAELFGILEVVQENLSWLSIYVPPTPGHFGSFKTYNLPNLEDLLIETTPAGREHLTAIGQALAMPRLRRLTFKTNYFSRAEMETLDLAAFTAFCQVHGRQLEFLHVQPSYSWTMGNYKFALQGLVDACPMLEHLVLHPRAEPVTHQNVKWVDIWTPSAPNSTIELWSALRGSLTRASFPKLEHIRELGLGLALFSDIPKMIPPCPASDEGDAVFEYRYPGIFMHHDKKRLDVEININVDSIYEGNISEEDDDYMLEEMSSLSGDFDVLYSTSSSEYSLGDIVWESTSDSDY